MLCFAFYVNQKDIYCCLLYYHSTPDHDAVRHDGSVIQNKHLGQTLRGDRIYVTIYWTIDDCDGRVDFKVTLVYRTSDIIFLF